MTKRNNFPTYNGTRILRLLKASPWRRPDDIAEALSISGPGVALRDLEEQGYAVKKFKGASAREGYLWACSDIGSRLVDYAIDLEIGEH